MNNPNPNNIPPNQNHACAACRYQRRKCNRDCPLAPYFPPDSQTKFLNAHKLFGVGNILKMIRSLPDPKDRDIAMATMMIQSDLRAKDPVLGCVGLIMKLQAQISVHQNELNFIRQYMASIHAHNQSTLMMNPNHGFVNDVDVVVAAEPHDHYVNQPQQLQLQLEHQEGGEGYEGILDHQESGGGGENGNFGQDLNNEQQWRLMNENVNESGLIEYGTGNNGMSNVMMMMMMKEEEEVKVGEDALVPVLEERQFFDGFDRLNETNIGSSSSENIPKVEELDYSIVQNEEQMRRKECSNSSINEEEAKNDSLKHVQEN